MDEASHQDLTLCRCSFVPASVQLLPSPTLFPAHWGKTFMGQGKTRGVCKAGYVILTVIGEQKGSVHYGIQGLPQQEAGVMRWF